MLIFVSAHAIPTSAVLAMLLSPLILVAVCAGYYGAAVALARAHPELRFRPLKLALSRFLVAVIVGYAAISSGLLGPWVTGAPLSFAIPLIPARFLEWLVVLWLWLGRGNPRPAAGRVAAHALAGTALSFVLDLGLVYWYLFGSALFVFIPAVLGS